MGNAAAISRKAHKVVEVLPGSPGDMCGLKAMEDFIVAIDGRDLMKIDANEMLQIVKVCYFCYSSTFQLFFKKKFEK